MSRFLWIWMVLTIAVIITACSHVPFYSPPLPRVRAVYQFLLPPSNTNAIGSLVAVRAHAKDTLLDLARYFDIGHDAILNANPKVDPWLLKKGIRVLLPTQHILPPGPRQGIVINLAALRLYYYSIDGRTVITHPVGIGRDDWATPEGNTSVIAKVIDPPWRVPPSIRAEHARRGNPLPALVPPGPDNPLGHYALRLGIPGYLIHGTNRPYGIGMRVSHGCIQLYPEDISALFHKIPVGTLVTISNQPYLVGRIGGRLYLEAHPYQLDDPPNPQISTMEQVRQAVLAAGVDPVEIDWNRALNAARLALGVPLPIYLGAPVAEAVIAAVSLVETDAVAGTGTW